MTTSIVTGAGRGIGRAIATTLKSAGHNVLVADIDGDAAKRVADELDPQGRTAAPHVVDVSMRTQVEAMLEAALDRWDVADVLVNNAAVGPLTDLWSIDDTEWDAVMAVNLRGTFLGCQVVGRYLMDRGQGRIVNMSSAAGQGGAGPNRPHYAATKAGIVGFTKAIARELTPHGVTVNAVAPAVIRTELLEEVFDDRLDDMAATVPVGRLGQPEEVAALIAYLVSEDAGYITGATLDINGGVIMR